MGFAAIFATLVAIDTPKFCGRNETRPALAFVALWGDSARPAILPPGAELPELDTPIAIHIDGQKSDGGLLGREIDAQRFHQLRKLGLINVAALVGVELLKLRAEVRLVIHRGDNRAAAREQQRAERLAALEDHRNGHELRIAGGRCSELAPPIIAPAANLVLCIDGAGMAPAHRCDFFSGR